MLRMQRGLFGEIGSLKRYEAPTASTLAVAATWGAECNGTRVANLYSRL